MVPPPSAEQAMSLSSRGEIYHQHRYVAKHGRMPYCLFACTVVQSRTESSGRSKKKSGCAQFFNVLGPLVNPVQPNYQMLGVYDLSMMRLYSYIYQEGKKHFCIVHTLDGYDEISLTDQFKVVSDKGEQLFVPEDLGFNRVEQHELDGGNTVEVAAGIFRDVLHGEGTEAQRDVVVINAAFAIQTVEQDKPIEECIEIARESLYGKKALKTLEKFVEVNKG